MHTHSPYKLTHIHVYFHFTNIHDTRSNPSAEPLLPWARCSRFSSGSQHRGKLQRSPVVACHAAIVTMWGPMGPPFRWFFCWLRTTKNRWNLLNVWWIYPEKAALCRTTWLEGNLCLDNITCKGHLQNGNHDLMSSLPVYVMACLASDSSTSMLLAYAWLCPQRMSITMFPTIPRFHTHPNIIFLAINRMISKYVLTLVG